MTSLIITDTIEMKCLKYVVFQILTTADTTEKHSDKNSPRDSFRKIHEENYAKTT